MHSFKFNKSLHLHVKKPCLSESLSFAVADYFPVIFTQTEDTSTLICVNSL